MTTRIQIDPKLDLVLERKLNVPRNLVWEAWITPKHIKEFFVPKPWTIADCEIELKRGGKFRTLMRSPEGQDHNNIGCYLEIVENELLAWTDGLLPGYRPKAEEAFMTAYLILEDDGNGTKYTAIAIHKNEEDRQKHEVMGFHQGWGIVVDQLEEYIQNNMM